MFRRYDPDATRGEVAATYSLVLDEFAHQHGLTRKINAAANTLVAVFRKRPELADQKMISLDVLPFASLPVENGIFALGEYAVFKERRASADVSILKDAVRKGITSLMADSAPQHDVWRFALFMELYRGEPPLWAALLDEEMLGVIFDGGQESARRLGPEMERRAKE